MRDLDEVLAQAEGARGRSLGGLTMPDDALAVLTGRIRARRARRHVLQAAVVVPVVAALAVGGWALRERVSAPMPFATAPSPTSTPSPDPRQSSDAGPAVLLPSEPGLPERYSLPDGLLGQAGPGWVLATYSPASSDQAGGGPGQTVVLLASPEGRAFEVLRLDTGLVAGPPVRWTQHTVVDWRPGETTALVSVLAASEDSGTLLLDSPPDYAELDLLTGRLGPLLPELRGLSFETRRGQVRFWSDRATGDVLEEDASGMRVVASLGESHPGAFSPDGDLLIVGSEVYDLRSGAVVGGVASADGSCSPVSWWTSDSVLALCTAQDASSYDGPYLDLRPRLVVVDRAGLQTGRGTELRRIEAGDPVTSAWSSAWVADGQVVVHGAEVTPTGSMLGDVCDDGVYLLSEKGFTPLGSPDPRERPSSFQPRAAGEHLVVESGTGCDLYPTPSVLSHVDLATGTATLMIGPPAELPAGESRLQDLTGWVLGD